MKRKSNDWTPARKRRFEELKRLIESGEEIPSAEVSVDEDEEEIDERNFHCRTCNQYFDQPRGTHCPICGRNNTFDSVR